MMVSPWPWHLSASTIMGRSGLACRRGLSADIHCECYVTTKGWGHINYIANLITRKLYAMVKMKKGEANMINMNQVTNHLTIFDL
jgi:hypothetical protein